MSKNRKLVIFDFDGTLADTAKINFELAKEILVKEGYPEISDNDIERFKKMHARDVFKELGLTPFKAVGLVKKVRKKAFAAVHEELVFAGIDQATLDLKDQGYNLGIITSNSELVVKKTMGKTYQAFDFLKTKGFFGKAQSIKLASIETNTELKNIVYVGDEIRDIEASKKAGVKVIAVSWGYNTQGSLLQNGPDALAKSPKDLVKLVNKLLQ